MKQLELIQKLSILHCIYQIIASAEGNIDEQRDFYEISFALNELGLNSIYNWDAALKLDPHDCFIHISCISETDKKNFRKLVFTIANMGGSVETRNTCARHVFQLCNI